MHLGPVPSLYLSVCLNGSVCPGQIAHLKSLYLLITIFKHELGMMGTISTHFGHHLLLSVRLTGWTDVSIWVDLSVRQKYMLNSIYFCIGSFLNMTWECQGPSPPIFILSLDCLSVCQAATGLCCNDRSNFPGTLHAMVIKLHMWLCL